MEPVENFATITTGGRNTQDRVEDGAYPFFVRSQTVERIDTYSFEGEAVLTAGDGVGTGKIFHYVNGKCDIHQRVYRISNFRSDVHGYFFFLFFAANFYNRIMQMTAKSSVDSVRREMISRMVVALPPRKEQIAIAGAISDANALIDSLELLIAKKRATRQGAMQELLSGQRRLPGFTGAWKERTLGEVCASIVDGTHFTPTYVEVGIPFYSVENVTADEFVDTKYITQEEHRKLIRRCRPQKGDILLTRIGAIGDARLIDWNVDASIYVSLALLKCNASIRPEFLASYMKGSRFRKDIEDRSLLNASPRKINMGDIGRIPIPLPSEDEQIAIATALSDMDAQLSQLAARLNKVRQIKQGMMQDLLTGRLRLV